MDGLDLKQLTQAVRTIAEEKNLPEETVVEVIEQAIAAAWRRDNGERDQLVKAVLNTNSGEATISVGREVAEEVENDINQISLEDAQKVKKDAKVGDFIEEKTAKATTFGRVAAQTAKQVVLQRLREAEREVVSAAFEDKVGEILNGTVQRVEPRVVRIDLGNATGIIPASEQIQGEYYSAGSRVKVLLKEIERGNRGPQLILSRASTGFIKLLFASEVPEIESGAVEIKTIAREAGRRSKIAVVSNVPGVDPVGTFVGSHGTRIQAVMNEVGDQEKIDIISYSDDTETFIKAALSPAEVQKIEIVSDKEGDKRAKVFVNEDQQSIAIGRGGQNVRLASQLTGYELDIETATKPAEKPRKNIEDSLLNAVEEATE
ncbi:transcription termination/antitermination protein NusA [Candidatus Saccharibacteria bacterium]|nr:transcription termination/antitermination protein NusA [Candidatus Saccharibacteria bacterium]